MSGVAGSNGVVRTQAVGLLAAGLAHDLNNMLGGIVTTAELLHARAAGAEEVRDLSAIVDQAVKASELVRQILAFSRQDMLNPAVADLGELLEQMAPVLSALTGPKVALAVRRGAAVRVRVDSTALERVLVNLVLNARDAILETRGRGRIELAAARIGAGERPEAGRAFMPAVSYGVLSVSDDGPGVDGAVAARIFEPYFTTRPKGQGLGLSSAFGLVKQSGGFLLLEPSAKGARFAVYLPEVSEAVEAAAAPVQPAGRLLLLVEDELMLRMSVARGLERLGWRVRQAADGEAALKRLAAERPAVMVSDIRMPGLDGIGLTSAARELWPGLPVLLTSGYADEGARAAVPGLGVGYLPKPYTVRTLGERLRELV
ncbi:response regulator [Sandaracinobacter neustonicus]|uniref:histidine kinase n=1 Tax=Sandaracinobacter neustonicus TaxID=1715348 RepID=A0A501XNV8_9SPHN|nr:response regulator [Sandaracinobacter neustonicus]TPE62220.1 response regulator [Sandaracinobacter neustonicus]